MSHRKLTQPAIGKPKPALTKLKELPPADRARILEIIRAESYRAAQDPVSRLVGFKCSMDVLFRFFHWQSTEQDFQVYRDRIAQVLSWEQQHPAGVPDPKLRESVGEFFIAHAIAHEDVKGFTALGRLYYQGEACRLQKEKFKLACAKFEQSSRTKLQAGLDTLADSFKKNPDALKLFQQACAVVGQNRWP